MKKVIHALGGGATAILLTVGLALSPATSAAALSTLYPNPNGTGTPAVYVSQLPTCSSLNTANAAGQGWIGDWRMPAQINARTGQSTLLLPCRTAGQSPRVWIGEYTINDTGAGGNEEPLVKILTQSVTCDGVTQNVVFTGGQESPWGSLPTPSGAWYEVLTPNLGTFCSSGTSQLQKINLSWQSRFNGTNLTGTAEWSAGNWSTSGSLIPPATNIGSIPIPGGAFETPIVCTLAVDTTDILTTIGSFFSGVTNWFTCLWIPSGWDRSAQLDTAWRSNGISRIGDIFNAALPGAGSVVCGTVVDIDTGLVDFEMSTCPAANAVPAWIKIAIASISTIGMLMLFVRRFQRTMGA